MRIKYIGIISLSHVSHFIEINLHNFLQVSDTTQLDKHMTNDTKDTSQLAQSS